MSAYEISGPTAIGTAGQLNQLIGDVSLLNITSANGDMVYADASNNLKRIAIGSAGQILTVAGGIPTWGANTGGSKGLGFMMKKNLTQLITISPGTITGWLTSGAGAYDTSGTLGTLSTTNGTFTVTTPGKYLINVGVGFTNSSNGGVRSITIFNSNGGQAIATSSFQPTGSVNIAQYCNLSANANLVNGDVIQVRVTFTNGNVTVQADPATWFGMTLLA